MSRDASGRARWTENRPAVAQIAGVFAIKSAEIERCKRGLTGEEWHLIKSQNGISSSNELFDSYLRLIISITNRTSVVDLEGFEPSTSSMPWRRAPNCATGPRSEVLP